MNPYGLTDSLAGISTATPACERCGSVARLDRGACLVCLLMPALEGDGSDGKAFAAALAAVEVREADWRLGHYQILEEIGRGGMGVIYRARQRHSRRIVALKRILSYHADSQETLERFRREAEAAASLDHPNILPIYEVGEAEDGLPFFSMKYAAGGSLLQARLALREEPRGCVALMAKIARAVQCAHRQGILHRDLKPGNILLDGSGEPLVSDFGLAKWLDTSSDLTRTLTIYGTPGYIAPEQAQGSATHLTPSADVYSLGAVLFDLLAGRPPLLGEHALAVIQQASEKAAPKLRTIAPALDRDLETICARCLERDPAARYHSAGDLAEDLERWLEGRPILARPVAPVTRVWRWSVRNPKLAVSIAACALLATLAGIWQLKNRRLENSLRNSVAWEHSILVTPIFDLDEVKEDHDLSSRLVMELRRAYSIIGPFDVRFASEKDQRTPAQARTILSGTVRRINHKLRLTLRLLDAASHDLLVRQTVEWTDKSTLPPEYSQRTYSLLDASDLRKETKPNADPGLRDKECSSLITAGRELADRRTQVDLELAERNLKEAIKLQPGSAKAYAELSKVMTMRIAYTSDRKLLPVAEQAARRAVALDPDSSDAHQALAAVLFHTGLFQPALQELQEAFECSGIISRGAYLASMASKELGRPDLAIAWAMVAEKNEPHPFENEASLGDCWAQLGEDDAAEQRYRHFTSLHPDQPDGWLGLCHLRLLQGKNDEARQIYNENVSAYTGFAYTKQMAAQVELFSRNFPAARVLYQELFASERGGGGRFFSAVDYRSALARSSIDTDPDKARALLEEAIRTEAQLLQEAPEGVDVLYRLAASEAVLGQQERAIDHLKRAVLAGWIDYRATEADPRFDRLRSVSDFSTLIEMMKHKILSLQQNAKAIVAEQQPSGKE